VQFSCAIIALNMFCCCRVSSKSVSDAVAVPIPIPSSTPLAGEAVLQTNIESSPEVTFDVMDEREMPSWQSTIPYIPNILRGKVIKIYDGDTITIACRYKSGGLFSTSVYRFSVRLAGIDCPELKTQNDDEKQIATIAKREVESKLMGKVITLKNVKTEKYGRILADVYVDNHLTTGMLHINDWLIKQRLAVAYDGKTKKVPKFWSQYYHHGEF